MSAWLAIVNPRSGGATRRHLDGVLDHFRRRASKTILTEYPGHATVLARDARGYDGIAVVGGDGTVFEVLQGMDRQKQTLAIMPTGRGNSLARDLGVYPPSLTEILAERRPSQIDLMEVVFLDSGGACHTVVSASTIAIGYPVQLVALANQRFRRFGKLCYAMAGGCVIPAFRQVRISYDTSKSATERSVTGILVSNTRHSANFVAFPNGRCNDGSFEALELATGYVRHGLHNLASISRLHFYGPTPRAKLTKLRMDWSDPEDVLIDGEVYAGLVSLEIRMLPAALRCLSNMSTL